MNKRNMTTLLEAKHRINNKTWPGWLLYLPMCNFQQLISKSELWYHTLEAPIAHWFYLASFSHEGVNHLSLEEYSHFWFKFIFLTIISSQITSPMNLLSTWYTLIKHRIPCRTHFTVKEVRQWVNIHEIQCLKTHHQTKVNGFVEWWHNLY